MSMSATEAYRAGFMSKLATFSKEAARFGVSMSPEDLKRSRAAVDAYHKSLESPYAAGRKIPPEDRPGWFRSNLHGAGNLAKAFGAKLGQGALMGTLGTASWIGNLIWRTGDLDQGRGAGGRLLGQLSRKLDRAYANARLDQAKYEIANGIRSPFWAWAVDKASGIGAYVPMLAPGFMAHGAKARLGNFALGGVMASPMVVHSMSPASPDRQLAGRMAMILDTYRKNPAVASLMDPTSTPAYISWAPTPEEVATHLSAAPEYKEVSYGAPPERSLRPDVILPKRLAGDKENQ